jgi:hypothetical protein
MQLILQEKKFLSRINQIYNRRYFGINMNIIAIYNRHFFTNFSKTFCNDMQSKPSYIFSEKLSTTLPFTKEQCILDTNA